MLYRLYQFLLALFPFITAQESRLISTTLPPSELTLFNQLQKRDQKHAVKIALYLSQSYPEDKLLLRAALLHDIGKIYKPLNPFQKIFSVILDKRFPKLALEMSLQKNSIMDIYYNHAQKGAQLARQHALDEELIYLIENHHSTNTKIDNPRLKLLISADNLY